MRGDDCAKVLPATIPEQSQQEQEQVDEVEIETERAIDREAFLRRAGARGSEDFQLLRVPRREADKDHDADHIDRELQRGRVEEDTHDRRDDESDETQEHEYAECGG